MLYITVNIKIKNTMQIQIRERYRHYKNKEYIVLAIAHHSETLEELVVYQALYDSKDFGSKPVWVRPREMFEDKVEVDDKLTDRFSKID